MRRTKLACWLARAASASVVVVCAVLAAGCGGTAPGPSDATAAEAGAGGEPDEETRADGAQPDGSASEPVSSEPTLDASASLPAASFVKASGATWEGTGKWAVEVALASPASSALRYELATGGTSLSGSDYTIEAQLDVAAGSSAAQVIVTIINDRVAEPRETLTLTIAGSDPPARYTLSIADDDDARWPSDDAVSEVDAARAFAGANLSGLAYRPSLGAASASLWMVRNGPSQLYQLTQNGALFVPLASSEWSQEKTLVFATGMGAPDAEGITFGEWSSPLIYVVSERDGAGPSAPSVLAYDTSKSATTLTATQVWNLSNDLRPLSLEPNTGPEALAWVPDSYLTSAGFLDEATGKAYDPLRYANHGAGLFFVGIEQTGGIYAYALDHVSGSATRIASIESGHPAVMALEFDRDTNYLWAWCDDTCQNHATILRVEDNPLAARKGRFSVRRSMNRPSSLPDVNNEGMTIAPSVGCTGDKKAVFWLEDGQDDHVLRRGTLPCGPFLDL